MALYEDIVYHILSWLPAKAIYKFKSASKSFSKITEDPSFIRKQYENSLVKDDTCIFIQPDMDERIRRGVELHPLPRNQPSSGISNDFLKKISNQARVLSSSNGLILYRTTNQHPTKLYICNPLTQSCSLIPNPINHDEDDLTILLECYQGDDDYSLFHFERESDMLTPWYRCRCNVYKAKEGVWKTMKGGLIMGGGTYLKFYCMPVFHNGLFYTCYSKSYILSYNPENGMTEKLRLPEQVDMYNMSYVWGARIFKWGKVSSSTRSICLVKLSKFVVFKVWFLKDYKSISWQKVLEVRVEAMGVKEKNPKVTSYMVMNGDLLIFATEIKVYSYGLAGERYMMIDEICKNNCGSYPCFISYSDTLRPC